MEKKEWYYFIEGTPYNSDDPAFFDIADKQWKKLLEKNYNIILSELTELISQNDQNIIPYPNKILAGKEQNWNIFPLFVWGKKQKKECCKCPNTTKLIESIPGIVTCSFSILRPNSKIPPHVGDSNVAYRCHLGLKCYGDLPEAGIKVRYEETAWAPGKLFAFCDAYRHEVWNYTDQERWILIIDILREEFLPRQKQICSEVKSILFWQLTLQRTNIITYLPKWTKKVLVKVTSVLLRMINY